MLYHQGILINIIPNQLFDRVVDLLKDVATKSSSLPLSPLLVGLKPDTLI